MKRLFKLLSFYLSGECPYCGETTYNRDEDKCTSCGHNTWDSERD